MSDGEDYRPRRSQPAPEQVDWHDEHVLAAWCERFNIPIERLLAAVVAVGPLPRAVEFYLSSQGRPTKPRPSGAAEILQARRELKEARDKQARSRIKG